LADAVARLLFQVLHAPIVSFERSAPTSSLFPYGRWPSRTISPRTRATLGCIWNLLAKYGPLSSTWTNRSFVSCVNDTIAGQGGVRDAGALTFGTLNSPSRFVLDKFHLTARSPPPIQLARHGFPDALAVDSLPKVGKQGFINAATTPVNQIIGMSNEAHEPISLPNQVDLFFP
jgi:hypothetical protein